MNQTCGVSIVQNMLAANSTDVNNQAMMSLMQEAKNAMASNDTNANACNSVDVNQSSCQYLAQKACCAQNSVSTIITNNEYRGWM